MASESEENVEAPAAAAAMTEAATEAEAEAEKKPKPQLKPVVILSVLLGVLLAFVIAGGIYHVRSGKALKAELAASKDELKHKTQLLAEQQEQIIGLSRQMHALREFSVTKANEAAAAATSTAAAPATAASSEPPAAAPAGSPPETVAPEATKAKPVRAPVARKAAPPPSQPPSQNCQLIGKSPEEQSATLQRCMQSMDAKTSRR